jgi:hypothetical protein
LECLASLSGRADTCSEIDPARDSKGRFYPLNYGDSDNCDFRFSIADCNFCRRADLGAFAFLLLQMCKDGLLFCHLCWRTALA